MILRFSPPAKAWSTNEVPPNVRAKIKLSKVKALWRDTAFYTAKSQGVGRGKWIYQQSNVQVTIPFPTNRRRDPSNYVGTVVKAIVDGLVIAGFWPDDNPDWVTIIEPILVVGNEVIVSVTPRTVVGC